MYTVISVKKWLVREKMQSIWPCRLIEQYIKTTFFIVYRRRAQAWALACVVFKWPRTYGVCHQKKSPVLHKFIPRYSNLKRECIKKHTVTILGAGATEFYNEVHQYGSIF